MDTTETETTESAVTKEERAQLTEIILSATVVGAAMVKTGVQAGLLPTDIVIACRLITESIYSMQPELRPMIEGLAPALDQGVKDGTLDILKLIIESAPRSTGISAKFALGSIIVTRALQGRASSDRITECLTLFGQQDWGPFLDEGSKSGNDNNVTAKKGMIYGIYRIYDARQDDDYSNKLYIVTDPDHSKTTAMLPEEYR